MWTGARAWFHPHWLGGPAPPGKTPGPLLSPSCRIPWGVGLGGQTRPWMRSSGNHMWGPHIPKTGRGWGHCRPPLPRPPPVSGKAAFRPLTPAHSHGGSGPHLISPDRPGVVPVLSRGPCWVGPPAQPGETPADLPACRGGRWQRWWAGAGQEVGAVVTLQRPQPLMPQGQTQETQETLQSRAHPPPQIAPSSLGGGVADAKQGWRHVAPFLATLEGQGWAGRPVLPCCAVGLCPRHLAVPRLAGVEPLPAPATHGWTHVRARNCLHPVSDIVGTQLSFLCPSNVFRSL